MARPEVKKYIRGCFKKISRRHGLTTVVEKTCANSLRVGFVNHVLPEAKFIFIRRNGLDAVSSALKRWSATVDLGYLFRKARFVPLSDFLYFAFRFVKARCHRLYSLDNRLAFWGPQLNGMDVLLKRYSLEEVCALQWKWCVERAMEDFLLISHDRVVEVEYEDFVTYPETALKRMLDFLGYPIDRKIVNEAVFDVYSESIGKGAAMLNEERTQKILYIIEDTQQRLGYA
jgi:hypothetical protein